MKLEVNLELREVFGGDGVQRIEEVETIKVGRKQSRSRTKKDLGINRNLETEEQLKEIKQEPVNTFKYSDNKKPILRLGGIHGKVWGSLRQAGKLLYQIGEPDFPSMVGVERMMQMVNISPIFPELENCLEMKTEGIPQVMAGGRNTMIVERFDVIPKCTTKIIIQYPEHLDRHIKKMIKQLENMGTLNKRRTQIKILKMKELKDQPSKK